jgi:hypothetical protein
MKKNRNTVTNAVTICGHDGTRPTPRSTAE